MITNPILPSPQAGTSGNPGVSFLQKFIPYTIQWGFIIGVVVFFFMLLIGAIKWISSSGDKQKLEEARSTLSNALIGLVILFAVFVILNLIDTFFGTQIMKGIKIPTLGG